MGKYEALAAVCSALERMEADERKELVDLINKKTELEDLMANVDDRLRHLTGRAADRFSVMAVNTTAKPDPHRESCIYLDSQHIHATRLPCQGQILYTNYIPEADPPEIRCWAVDEKEDEL